MDADEAVQIMFDSDDEFAWKVFEGIRSFEGWTIDLPANAKRVRQCLRGDVGRGFKFRWCPIVARFAEFYGVTNLLHAPLDDATRRAQIEMRDEQPIRQMRTVRPQGRARHYGT